MPHASIKDLVRDQAQRSQRLFDNLVHLHADMSNDRRIDPLTELAKLADDARQLYRAIDLLRIAYSPIDAKPRRNRRDCPNQIPLWHDAPANLEQ